MTIIIGNNDADRLLSDAIKRGDINSIKTLLNANADPNTASCNDALEAACAAGYREAVELISEAKAKAPRTSTFRRGSAFSLFP